ncbi:MAG: glycosyltransferase [Rhodoglobus sp.]|nr:glycosyltransferase [Rhodoglobus sp.]
MVIGTRGYPSYYGGFETAVRKLAPHLADSGWDVTVYGRRGETRDDDPNLDTRVRRVVTRGSNSKSFSTLSYGFWSALDAWRRKPDVALVMNVANGFWLPLLSLRGIPTIVNVDGIEWERGKWGRVAKAVFRWGARLTARLAQTIIVDSHEIGRRWRTDFGRAGTYIPYGGEDPGVLPLEPGLSERQYVLVVARFVPENSIAEFFEAVPAIADSHDVVIVGSAGFGGELDAIARKLDESYDRVRWLGHVNDDRRLHALWQHAGVYFHGHSVGGTNPALVQAMVCGAPIVARDTVYNREVLGDAGVFTNPEPTQIAEALQSVLASPRQQSEFSERGRERARNVYNDAAVNRAYEAALRAAAEAAR